MSDNDLCKVFRIKIPSPRVLGHKNCSALGVRGWRVGVARRPLASRYRDFTGHSVYAVRRQQQTEIFRKGEMKYIIVLEKDFTTEMFIKG